MAKRFALNRPTLGKDKRLSIQPFVNQDHRAYVDLVDRMQRHYAASTIGVHDKVNDWWKLFLAQQEDTRDPVDELWRSDVFVPLPFTTTRTKAAQTTEILGSSEPVWQVEATRETGNWYEQSKHYTRLLDYTHRANAWRKFIYKLATARSVQGTTFLKVVYKKKSHMVRLPGNPKEEMKFVEKINEAIGLGAPEPPDPYAQPEEFEKWRKQINLVQRFGLIPAAPQSGPTEIVEYQGPVFQQLPLWSVFVDPLVDEMADQRFIIHRMVRPLSWVLKRADDDPNSPRPYYFENVEAAYRSTMGDQILETQLEELAGLMGLNPERETHPYFEQPVELMEVWSPDEEYKYAIVMNRQWIINKHPFEHPLLTSSPNIFALRNIIVPGHFYGLSDYQEPEKLFKELNSFRRIRLDGATLNTLPVFVKAQGVHLSEALQKIKPGLILTLPKADAIQSLIKHQLPAEAYREPAEIKLEIEDATEVYSSTKGAPATVGRVTGTEYQGRANNTLLKYKVDAMLIEEELLALPSVILSMFAQMGDERLRLNIGGDPDAIVDVSRSELIEALGYRYHFRGATKNISADLQVQQLTSAVNSLGDALTPVERRFALMLILDLLDIRGYSKILSLEGDQTVGTVAGAQTGAATATAGLEEQQANAAGVQVPGTMTPEAAAAANQEGVRAEGAAPSGPGAMPGGAS